MHPRGRRDGPLPKFENLRVLVADDNAVNREVATEALSRLGARVDTWRTARTRSEPPQTMRMTHPDGWQHAADRRFHRRPHDPPGGRREGRDRIPIVALTAHVIGAAAEEWHLAGMNGIMHKPFTIAQLAQCLMEQVPQFRTLAGGPFEVNDSGLAQRELETGPLMTRPSCSWSILRLWDNSGRWMTAKRIPFSSV